MTVVSFQNCVSTFIHFFIPSFIHSFVRFKDRISCRKQWFYIAVCALCNSISHIIGSINVCCVMTSTPVAATHFMLNHVHADESLIKYTANWYTFYIGFQSLFYILLCFVLLCTPHTFLNNVLTLPFYLSLSLSLVRSFLRHLSLPFVRFCLHTFDLLSMDTVSLVVITSFSQEKITSFFFSSVVI